MDVLAIAAEVPVEPRDKRPQPGFGIGVIWKNGTRTELAFQNRVSLSSGVLRTPTYFTTWLFLCLRLQVPEALCFRVVCLSKAWNTFFPPVHGSVGPSDQLWPFFSLAYRSVHLDRFPGISRRMHARNGLKFCMLMYPDNLQNWLPNCHGLLIFLILMLFWLSETGQFVVSSHFPENKWRE